MNQDLKRSAEAICRSLQALATNLRAKEQRLAAINESLTDGQPHLLPYVPLSRERWLLVNEIAYLKELQPALQQQARGVFKLLASLPSGCGAIDS